MFEQANEKQLSQVLTQLGDALAKRKQASPESSYVAQLLHQGEDKILKKVIEEAGEVLMASKDADKTHLVKEVADVWFHTLVLLTYHGLRPEDVLNELQQRQNTSGLVEKANRQPH